MVLDDCERAEPDTCTPIVFAHLRPRVGQHLSNPDGQSCRVPKVEGDFDPSSSHTFPRKGMQLMEDTPRFGLRGSQVSCSLWRLAGESRQAWAGSDSPGGQSWNAEPRTESVLVKWDELLKPLTLSLSATRFR